MKLPADHLRFTVVNIIRDRYLHGFSPHALLVRNQRGSSVSPCPLPTRKCTPSRARSSWISFRSSTCHWSLSSVGSVTSKSFEVQSISRIEGHSNLVRPGGNRVLCGDHISAPIIWNPCSLGLQGTLTGGHMNSAACSAEVVKAVEWHTFLPFWLVGPHCITIKPYEYEIFLQRLLSSPVLLSRLHLRTPWPLAAIHLGHFQRTPWPLVAIQLGHFQPFGLVCGTWEPRTPQQSP